MNTLRTFTLVLGALWFASLAPAATNDTVAPGVKEKSKTCFQCQGVGECKCLRPGCRDGKVDCPGPCVKLSGKWEKRDLPGHGPDELWQLVKFIPRGKGYIHRNHVGEYFTVDAAGKVSIHSCPTCGQTSLVNCPACKGKGTVTCPVCDGKKAVPEAWSAFDHPRMKNRPLRFKLKDGRALVGRKVMISGTRATIRTETGDVQVETSDILAEEQQLGQP